MLIYFNGDSHAAGVELGDDVISEYPGLSNYDYNHGSNNSKVEWKLNTHKNNHYLSLERKEKWNLILKLEYERSFPNRIKNKLGIDVINHAHGGASMDRIVRTSLKDLIQYKKQHEEIIAVIATTDPSRREYATCYRNTGRDAVGELGHFVSISSHYSQDGEEDADMIRKYNALYERNYHQLVLFYKNVILLQDFCKVNNIKLIWVAGITNVVNKILVEPQYKYATDLTALKEYAKFEYTIDMDKIAKEIFYDVKCPHSHFSEKVHEEVAIQLAKILKEKYNV